LGKPRALWLNPGVRLYTRYKRLRPHPQTRIAFYWLLAAALLAFLGWEWWSLPRPPAASPSSPTRIQPALPRGPVPPNTRLRPTATPPVTKPTNLVSVPRPPATANVPSVEIPFTPRPVQNVLEAQLELARQGISSGSIDGVLGSQTRAALRAFQEKARLPVTGELDLATKARLLLSSAPFTEYAVTTNDLARLEPVSATWLGKSEQDRLDYETVLELVAEKAEAHPNLIRRLNPSLQWTNVTAGTRVKVPNSAAPPVAGKAAFVRIELSTRTLQAFDANTNLLAHFPCSIARFVEKRPIGELHVVAVAQNPVYIFDPENFPESEEGRRLGRKLVLPSGPNNPVGTAWISLDRPGYGIHGTPRPEDVGRTESHGCFRLANWNADYLLRLVSIGTPVFVEP
jgi:lipoprotein-anchoring transpeptidase ErfK/SrfK